LAFLQSAFLSSVDVYLIWALALLLIGVAVTARLGRRPGHGGCTLAERGAGRPHCCRSHVQIAGPGALVRWARRPERAISRGQRAAAGAD
jgi:hypothetical protein